MMLGNAMVMDKLAACATPFLENLQHVSSSTSAVNSSSSSSHLGGSNPGQPCTNMEDLPDGVPVSSSPLNATSAANEKQTGRKSGRKGNYPSEESSDAKRGMGKLRTAEIDKILKSVKLKGWLYRLGKSPFGSHWHKRYFVLRQTTLSCFKSIDWTMEVPSREFVLGPTYRVDDTGRIMQGNKEMYTITLHSDESKPTVLGSRDPEVAFAWLTKIKESIEQCSLAVTCSRAENAPNTVYGDSLPILKSRPGEKRRNGEKERERGIQTEAGRVGKIEGERGRVREGERLTEGEREGLPEKRPSSAPSKEEGGRNRQMNTVQSLDRDRKRKEESGTEVGKAEGVLGGDFVREGGRERREEKGGEGGGRNGSGNERDRETLAMLEKRGSFSDDEAFSQCNSPAGTFLPLAPLSEGTGENERERGRGNTRLSHHGDILSLDSLTPPSSSLPGPPHPLSSSLSASPAKRTENLGSKSFNSLRGKSFFERERKRDDKRGEEKRGEEEEEEEEEEDEEESESGSMRFGPESLRSVSLERRGSIGLGPPIELGDMLESMVAMRSATRIAGICSEGCWQLVKLANGLRFFEEISERGAPASCCSIPCMSAVGTVDAPCYAVFRLIMDLGISRNEWDVSYDGARVVEVQDGHTDVVHVRLKPISLGMGLSTGFRDLCKMRYWQRQADGCYVILYHSVEHRFCPPTPGCVRAELNYGGFIIAPAGGPSPSLLSASSLSFSATSSKSIVMHVLQLDPKGWLPHCLGIPYELHVQLLSRVAGIREFFAQTRGDAVSSLLGLSGQSARNTSAMAGHPVSCLSSPIAMSETHMDEGNNSYNHVDSTCEALNFERGSHVDKSGQYPSARQGKGGSNEEGREREEEGERAALLTAETEKGEIVDRTETGGFRSGPSSGCAILDSLVSRPKGVLLIGQQPGGNNREQQSEAPCSSPFASLSSPLVRGLGKATVNCERGRDGFLAQCEKAKIWNWAYQLGSLNRGPSRGGVNCWSEAEYHNFTVRSKSYLADKMKRPAGRPSMSLVSVDWLKSERRIDHVVGQRHTVVQESLLRSTSLNTLSSEPKKPFFFVVNMQVPASCHYSMVYFWAMDSPPDPLSLFGKFLYGDDAFRNARLKLIPRIHKGAWVVKRSVGTTPLMVAGALSVSYYRGENYIECDVDIGSSAVAFGVVRFVLGYVRTLEIDIAFLVQSNAEEELPENLLGTIRISHLEPDAALDIDRIKKEA